MLNVRQGISFAVADAYRNWYDLRDVEFFLYREDFLVPGSKYPMVPCYRNKYFLIHGTARRLLTGLSAIAAGAMKMCSPVCVQTGKKRIIFFLLYF